MRAGADGDVYALRTGVHMVLAKHYGTLSSMNYGDNNARNKAFVTDDRNEVLVPYTIEDMQRDRGGSR